MLLSAFRGKETSKMVSSTFSLESEMLLIFQAKFGYPNHASKTFSGMCERFENSQ